MTESAIDTLSSISVSGVPVRLQTRMWLHITASELRAYLEDGGLGALNDGGLADTGEEATTF
jgi:hypothetical protein